MFFAKHFNILDYALSSLWRRKFKNLSVMLVFGAVIFLIASFQMVTNGLNRAAVDSLSHTPEITIQHLSAGRQEAIPLAYQEKLAGIFGVKRIVPRIWGYYFDETNGANYTVAGLDPRKTDPGRQLDRSLSEGLFPETEERGGAVIGPSVLEVMDLGARRRFSMFRPDLSLKDFRVAGVFSPETSILTSDLIVMSLEDARELFAVAADKVTDLCVYVSNPTEIDTIARKISAILPDTRVLTKSQIRKTYQVVFGWRSGFASICLLSALAAFVILAWDKASGLSPEERREISILKILGWETNDILTCRFWESLLISAIAFAMGCSLAYIHVVFFQASLFRPVMVGWSVIRPVFQLLPDFALTDYLLIFCLTVLPYLAVNIIPSWRNAIVPADQAMH